MSAGRYQPDDFSSTISMTRFDPHELLAEAFREGPSANGQPDHYGEQGYIGPDLDSSGSGDDAEWPLLVQIKQEPAEALDEEEILPDVSESPFQLAVQPIKEEAVTEGPPEDEQQEEQNEAAEMETDDDEDSSDAEHGEERCPTKKRQNTEKKEKGPYKCSRCEFTYSTLIKLSKHYKLHTGERPYGCDVCGKSFVRLAPRETHMRRHDSSYVPLTCPQCGFVARRGEVYKAHMRLHTGEKPYKCETCGKTFRVSRYRNRHALTHTVEKKLHTCDICGKVFPLLASMISHQRSHSVVRKKLVPENSTNIYFRDKL